MPNIINPKLTNGNIKIGKQFYRYVNKTTKTNIQKAFKNSNDVINNIKSRISYDNSKAKDILQDIASSNNYKFHDKLTTAHPFTYPKSQSTDLTKATPVSTYESKKPTGTLNQQTSTDNSNETLTPLPSNSNLSATPSSDSGAQDQTGYTYTYIDYGDGNGPQIPENASFTPEPSNGNGYINTYIEYLGDDKPTNDNANMAVDYLPPSDGPYIVTNIEYLGDDKPANTNDDLEIDYLPPSDGPYIVTNIEYLDDDNNS